MSGSPRTRVVVTTAAVAALLSATQPAHASPADPSDSKAHEYGAALYRVDAVTGSDAWAGGGASDNGVLVEHWDGSRWTAVTTPHPPHSNGFRDVDARTDTDVWAVGDFSRLGVRTSTYAQHWDGSTWSVERTPNPGKGYYRSLEAVTTVSKTDAWAVGVYLVPPVSASRPLIEHWNGLHWRVSAGVPELDCPAALSDVAQVTADDIWAVGSSQCRRSTAHPLIEHWDGSQWSPVHTPELGDDAHLKGVSVVAADDVWAAGSVSSATGTRTLIEHWDGTAWSRVPSPNSGSGSCDARELYRVSASAADEAWSVGYRHCPGLVVPVTLHWDGTAWSSVSSPAPPFADPAAATLSGVVAVSDGSAIAVGYASVPAGSPAGYVQQWNGRHWTFQ